MRAGLLLPLFFTAGAFCGSPVPSNLLPRDGAHGGSEYGRDDDKAHHKQAIIDALVRGIRLDATTMSKKTEYSEPSCFREYFRCSRTVFREIVKFNDEQKVKIDIEVKDVTARRVRNSYREGTLSLTTVRSTADIKTTSWGWNVGVSVTGGFLSPAGGAVFGTLSGGYHESTTDTKQISLSNSLATPCQARFECWVETWTVQYTLTGPCERTNEIVCSDEIVWSSDEFVCYEYLEMEEERARVPRAFHRTVSGRIVAYPPSDEDCEQWRVKKSDACHRPADEICTVTSPLLGSDGEVWQMEIPFRKPILELWDKPTIIGYRAGYFLLRPNEFGYIGYSQFPESTHRYLDRDFRTHYYEAYPILEDAENYQHPPPRIVRVGKSCYLLATEEWFCPNRPGPDKYYIEKWGYFSKKNAQVPTEEAMAAARKAGASKAKHGNNKQHVADAPSVELPDQ
ncbi:hypothetical protein ED733_000954 [Metarhizium rileyi]|uniref:Uncharacterized protein n=1 Tax=Metarhizium rileyi (strain RCEF 4871) TaxID=1649241 RepID=A0A5C6G6H7_METRR|nr:hypothetical protein ED733_000954 [Metarhizium rileyi]